MTIKYPDGKKRCGWMGDDGPMLAYHDDEWGVPEWDDRALYEKLILDGFQAGLSWRTILHKRENFRRAFEGFDPEVIAGWGKRKTNALMKDAGIVRNRAKIDASVRNAKAYLKVVEREGSFADYLWRFTGGKTKQNKWKSLDQLPAETPESRAMSKALKAEGFNFVGPTICYAFMQAVGMVNDHTNGCYRWKELKQGGTG